MKKSGYKNVPWQRLLFSVFMLMFLGSIYLLNADFQYVGKTVTATKNMPEGAFQNKSVHVLEHTVKGSMGYILDTPLQKMRFGDFARRYYLQPKGKKASLTLIKPAYAEETEKKQAVISEYDDIMVTVYFGGPVDKENLTILHDGSVSSRDQKKYHAQDLVVTDNLEVLYALFEQQEQDKGGQYKIFAGYTAWGSGQLFDEVQRELWDVHDLDTDKIWLDADAASLSNKD